MSFNSPEQQRGIVRLGGLILRLLDGAWHRLRSAGSDQQFISVTWEDCAAWHRTLVPLDFEQEDANVLILMVFHSGVMEPSQINGKHGARGPSRKFRTTTDRLLTKKARARVIVEEDSQPQSRAERTRSLILAAVRVWELKRGIGG